MMSIMNQDPPSVDFMDKDNKFSSKFKQFVAKCLIKDINKRPKAHDLLGHGFFKVKKDNDYIRENVLNVVSKRGMWHILVFYVSFSVFVFFLSHFFFLANSCRVG